MSGVFGLVDSQKRSPWAQLRRMADALRLSEWTRTQTWMDEPAGVALGQVNIGLFSTDPQPLRSADGALAVVFFGELSNVEHLR
ncbi:MAG TPA: hypothetical protein ENI37_03725, partial [Chloroflexi bacterium]|nr:hypothetical protein [Chloroflexota bacterium]